MGRPGRAFADIDRYWQTLRHLKPVQFYGRLRFRLARVSPDLAPPPPFRVSSGRWTAPASREPSLIGPREFIFLNEPGDIAEIGWDGPEREKLWRYNQHYFDDLNARDAAARSEWHRELVRDWMAANPPGSGSGWEPYPTSLRIVNWIKWAMAGNPLPAEAAASLAVQARWLTRRLEWHLLGNHLFANAKALIFAGTFFDGTEASGWRDLGYRILKKQVPEQILADGGQFELSPMYHALALEDMLDLVNLTDAFPGAATGEQEAWAEDWRARIPAMSRWLATMCHPDGEVAFFNDAAIGIAPSPAALSAYRERLGLPDGGAPGELVHLRESGYVRLSRGAATVLADVARIGPDYLPGHAHADTLSFELSLDGRRIVVNSGTSVYGASAERLRQRGTAAHSTLVIDGADSSEVWSGFRVARRARPFDLAVSDDGDALLLAASHDGYSRLAGRPVHRRSWKLDAGGLSVVDEITGEGNHDARAIFHFAPGLDLREAGNGFELIDRDSGNRLATLTAGSGAVAAIMPSSWHPRFGQRVETSRLDVNLSGRLPLRLETSFHWSRPA